MSLNANGFELAQRLMEHVLEQFTGGQGPNREAHAIFAAITYMFDGSGSGKSVSVDSYLVHNLAACARVAMTYDSKDHIPWDQSDHDGIIIRTLNGMVQTLIAAVKMDTVRRRDGKVYFGHFLIPEWLIREAGR